MHEKLSVFCLLTIGLTAAPALAESSPDSTIASLCELQTTLTQGEKRSVRVEGVYLSGLEGQYLVTSDYSGRSTSIEFQLRTHRLWKQLVRLSDGTNTKEHVFGDGEPVLVVFEGEVYGPQVPDPKLPEAIRKNYHPAWDHNNASMTKMVVHVIQRVHPLPSDHPCASPKSDPLQRPCFQNSAPKSGGVPTSQDHETGQL
jgi:hypothetical protein